MSKDVDDHHEQETFPASSPFLLVLVVILLYAYGRWKWAVAAVTTMILAVGLSTALSKWNLLDNTANDVLNNKDDITMKRIRKYYKKDMTIQDILHEIQDMEQFVLGRPQDHDAMDDSRTMRTKVVAFLEALTSRCCRERDEQKQKKKKPPQQQPHATDIMAQLLLATSDDDPNLQQQEIDDSNDDAPSLQVCGYLAAHFALQMYPSTVSHLEVAQAALALYAVVSQHDQVQEQLLQHAHHLQVPIQVMQRALDYARDELQENNASDEQKEHQIADTVQKGCLLLGALADNSPDMATAIVEHHGLQVILDAASWFRHHELVVQWSLWAVFQLCYEHERNQRILVETGGLSVICTNLQTLPSHPQIVRHGMGILLDTLRLLSPHTPNLVRLALAAGLQEAVLAALRMQSNVLDITMMGEELLRGTGYKGPMPTLKDPGAVLRLS